MRSSDGETWEPLDATDLLEIKRGGMGQLLGRMAAGWQVSTDAGETWETLIEAEEAGRMFYFDGVRLW